MVKIKIWSYYSKWWSGSVAGLVGKPCRDKKLNPLDSDLLLRIGGSDQLN